MSRELLGLVFIAVLCIIVGPFFKENDFPKNTRVFTKNIKVPYNTTMAQANSPKKIVLLTQSFLPTTFAGSELSAYETIKYLRLRGHTIIIFTNKWSVNEYDGFKIYKYDDSEEFCKTEILNADYVFFQMDHTYKNMELINQRKNDVFIFIHLIDSNPWLLQQKTSFPLTVVYNSNMTQDTLPTLHTNMRMIPYVNTEKFTEIRNYTADNQTVCLVNCNQNKGGSLLLHLAEKMPDVQFIGVKGGYSSQIVDTSFENIKYVENQKDIASVYKEVGILIMPSKNETWGRTAVEAMASGIPVIHSESPGLVECVGGAGILCPYNDEEAWMNAIRKLLSDKKYRENLRVYGYKRVEEIEIEQKRGQQELTMKIEA